MNMGPKQIGGIVGAVVAGIVALTVVGGSFYTVDQGERGVILRNGKVTSVETAGLHFKAPIIDDVVYLTARDQLRQFDDLWLYSFDQQNATMDITINWVPNAEMMQETYGRYSTIENLANKVIDPNIYDAVKNVFGNYTAVRAIQDREAMGDEIQAAVKAAVNSDLLTISSVQVKNVDFSEAYENSVEERMLAEVEVQKIRQNAAREAVQAEIVVIKADAEAAAQVARATAQATAITLVGEAEASAILARGEALRDSPDLVELVKAEAWNGVLPVTMVPNATVPFLNLR